MTRTIALLIGVTMALAGQAQRFFFENLGVQQGLPASKVYTVLQDGTGMVWIGTEVGLSRYDGLRVVTYGRNEGVADNGVRSLHHDAQGRLWVGHLGGGISVLEGRTFRTVRLPGATVASDVTGIAHDAQGHIWVVTFGDGAIRISSVAEDGTAQAERFGLEQGFNTHIAGLTRLADGTLCFIEGSGSIDKLDAAKATLSPFTPKGMPEDERFTTLYEDAQGHLWLGTHTAGAFHVDPATGKVERFDLSTGLSSNFILCFAEDSKGRVWIGAWDGGIARVERDGIRLFNTSNGTSGNSIRCIARDREGNMLVGTNAAGLDIFKGERLLNFTEKDGLPDPQVWAVTEDRQGRVWFGTNRGLSFWDPNERSTARVKSISAQESDLNTNLIRALKEDDRGTLWVGTEDAGVFSIAAGSLKPVLDREVSASILNGKVTALEYGGGGVLWVGTVNGLVRAERGGVPVLYRETDGLAGKHVVALYRDADGSLWVGSLVSGVSRIDQKGQVKAMDLGQRFTPTCFTRDQRGRMWVGTEAQGVWLLEGDRVVASYGIDDGLLSNAVKSLITDREGNVWIGSSRGLNEWHAATDRLIAYTERAGFTGIEAKPSAVSITRQGKLWFGTAHGAARISPSMERLKGSAPLIGIRSLRIDRQDRPVEQGVKLDHSENDIRIEFGSVSLSDPHAVRYRYMLDGLHTEWQPVTEESGVHYPALPPNAYVFRVEAMDSQGQWSEAPAEWRFTILPPWYRSWWFYTGLALVLGISLFSYIKVRERQLRLRNLVLERKVEERTAEVVEQSKEIAGQKVRIEELLLNILPREISEELKDKGKATARRHDHVTVMFTDMKGFTQVAESMTPEQLVHELDECFIHFDAIMGRYGIEKIKTIGDAYMCAAGIPSPDRHHAVRIILAAMEVQELMRQWQEERKRRGEHSWVLRIGVHSGPVVAGVVGRRKFAYDIWGDTVNTASRMESSGVAGELNMSEATHALVSEYFECEHRGAVEAKNKGKIDMYFVRRLKATYSEDAQGLRPSAKLLSVLGVAQPAEELA